GLAHQLPEGRVVADWIEVGVVGRERAELLPAFDRLPEVRDGVGRASRQALATRHVVEQHRELGVSLGDLQPSISGLSVLARFVEGTERHPEFKATRLVGLPGRSAQGDDRRARLLGKRGPLDAGGREDERPGWRLDRFTVELKCRPATLHEVELLLLIARLGLVMLVDDPVALLVTGPGVDSKRSDAEV